MSKFESAHEFERELAKRIQQVAVQRNATIDQLKNEIAYERFLARTDPASMAIKGGYAVKCHVPISPHTKDLDLILQDDHLPHEKAKLPRAVRDVINEQLEACSFDDHFRFDTGEALGFSDLTPYDAAARMNIRAYIGDSQERFTTFPLDVALSNTHVLPPQMVIAPNHLSWAGIDPASVSSVPPEHLFADKLLIYVASRNENRVGDLAHMALLAEAGLDIQKVATVARYLAKQRGVTQDQLDSLSNPPQHWSPIFERVMSGVKQMSLDTAFMLISDTHKRLQHDGLLENID